MTDLTPSQFDLLRAVRRHHVLRYPTGETRRYFDDGTYNSAVGGRVGELEAAGLVKVGALHTPQLGKRYHYHEIELTDEGVSVLDVHTREESS